MWDAPPPPPPIIFERLKLPQRIIYRRKENLSESPNHLKYRENILISRFYEDFSRNSRNLGHFWQFEKISNCQNMNISHIILKHVIWRFQIYNLFREIFKFRKDKSNNVFCEILKCFFLQLRKIFQVYHKNNRNKFTRMRGQLFTLRIGSLSKLTRRPRGGGASGKFVTGDPDLKR